MKYLYFVFLILVLTYSAVSAKKEKPSTLSTIIQSNSFNISIERLDFGYLKEKQYFYFDKYTNSMVVTHRNLISGGKQLPLENTELNLSFIDSLHQFCSTIHSFEVDTKPEHDKVFNSLTIHDFIYLQNESDTVLLSDVYSKGINELPELINSCAK